MVHWILGKLYTNTKVPNSRAEKVISLDKFISFLSLFQDRRNHIVAYRGAIFNQKGCPMIH